LIFHHYHVKRVGEEGVDLGHQVEQRLVHGPPPAITTAPEDPRTLPAPRVLRIGVGGEGSRTLRA
jgi:hypothetical protein